MADNAKSKAADKKAADSKAETKAETKERRKPRTLEEQIAELQAKAEKRRSDRRNRSTQALALAQARRDKLAKRLDTIDEEIKDLKADLDIVDEDEGDSTSEPAAE